MLAKFAENRQAISQLYARLPLDDGYRRRAEDYYKEFFQIIADPRQVRRELIDTCVGRATS